VLLAAWFHDAVYDDLGNLEARSATLAELVLATTSAGRRQIAEVARLVRLTAHHKPEDDDLAGQVLCDADLAILAADEPRYREYVDGVRREHAAVPDPDFRAGRAAVLRDLAAKPTLFHTRYARTHWEEPARANLARELAALDPR
jgi:predicted metal-dependent HD superfamily phosphohydrolase